ncbi:MAG: single-stranded-DNA-specific exonuclease RecJ [Patescibacteria group bacterium]|nr:single-stranded-DNA-specific exonuclease RecJ [Patescibacteria group bacterium]
MKQWVIRAKKSDNIVEQLLINRKIPKKDWDNFLHPQYENLLDPRDLNDIDKAVGRIIQAINNKETIGIFADYDADGVTGAAILANFFDYIGAKTAVYIPSREEGYGLNENGLKDLRKHGCKLIITVDLGITGKEQVKTAKKLDMDVIITDHHLFKANQLPKDSLALVHPQLSKKYANKELTGGGVAFKLIQAIAQKLGKPSQHQLKWFLDMAAVSTVCDMAPLIGENRAITKFGMKVLAKTKNIGLEELMKTARVDLEKISTYTLSFQIGPRINAPGRMDHAQISYYLLTTRNRHEAKEIANKLDKINRQRQDDLGKAIIEAVEQVEKKGLLKNKIILVKDKKWSEGIIGLIAGRLTEKFCRPVIVFHEGEKELKGSARSISEFHILEALDGAKKFIIKYGGHAGAAGMQVSKNNYSKLHKKLIEIADIKLSDKDLNPKIKIDAEVKPPKINLALFDEIKKLEPFGMGNSRPVFLTRRLAISRLQLVGKDQKHLKLLLSPSQKPIANSPALPVFDSEAQTRGAGRQQLDAISFNCETCHKDLQIGEIVDTVYSLDENIWNGSRKVQLKILDIQKSR